jgi:hypothetical protein
MTVGLAGGVPVSFITVGEDSQDDVDGFIVRLRSRLSL